MSGLEEYTLSVSNWGEITVWSGRRCIASFSTDDERPTLAKVMEAAQQHAVQRAVQGPACAG